MWKHASMKSWRAASALALLLCTTATRPGISLNALPNPPSTLPSNAARQSAARSAQKPANELMLAGLRPGRDTLGAARKLYGDVGVTPDPDDDRFLTWRDPCRKRSLRIEADKKDVIQTIAVEEWDSMLPCRKEVPTKLHSDLWRTGHGLALSDPQTKVLSTYGPPGSGGPSTDGGRELELMYYAFDWAGSDVPQVMEIFCDRSTKKVVHITLAYPSL
jgi:hypothetical protein